MKMKILMVLTSHDQLGNTGRKTGFWLEEFAAPYFVFRDAGVELTLASPKGGQPPIDPKSDLPENQTPAMARFKKDEAAKKTLAHTIKLADAKAEDFDTVFYVGGHGPMWDLAENPVSIALIESFYNSGKPVALVCHSPGTLRHVTYKGEPLVKGKQVTGFTNGEEEEVQLINIVPFLVEDELMRLGAIFEKVRNWQPFSIVDGRLVTGQNPASSTIAAKNLLKVVAAEAVKERAPSHQPGQDVFKAVLSEDIDWKPFAAFPPSVRLAVVVGQPSEKGPYVIRVKVPRGVKLMPHKHPEDRIYTVISGIFYIGLGDQFDAEKLVAYPPGAVIILPGNTSHFHWAKSGDYITQVTAIGPLGIEYVDFNDDPRTKNLNN
jgi:putative intracellular protease/amidase/quercetin dioxygenase-like cupin family protein